MTPESLLLLEDDALLAEQTRRAFARHGIEVHHAADLQQAHALLATLATLDAAVLDQNLGNDNGLDLVQPLQAPRPECRAAAAPVRAARRAVGPARQCAGGCNPAPVAARLWQVPSEAPGALPRPPRARRRP